MASLHHTEWGGSKVSRNVRCTGAVRACAGLTENRDTDYAAEGRLAHSLAEAALRDKSDLYELVRAGVEFDVSNDPKKPEFHKPTFEMADYLEEGYISQIELIPGELFVEETHPFSFAPGNHGTADAVVLNRRRRHLHVGDLKYGMGILCYAERNEQLESYAIAVLDAMDLWHLVDTVTLAIYQPRRDWIDEVTVNIPYLEERKRYFETRYYESKTDKATLVPGLVQCCFCPKQATCEAAYEYTLAAITGDIEKMSDLIKNPIKVVDSTDVDDKDLERLLYAEDYAKKMFKAVGEKVYELVEKDPSGRSFKLVAGRGRRKFKDEKQAEEEMKRMRFKATEMYNIRLASPAQAEKIAGKRQKAKIDALVTRNHSKPVLVPLSDPRPPLRPVTDDFDDLDAELDLGLDDTSDDDLGF